MRRKRDIPEAEYLAANFRCTFHNAWTNTLETRYDEFTFNRYKREMKEKETEAVGWIKGFLFAYETIKNRV